MSTYSTTVLADNPYVFYRLDDTSLTAAVDASTNGLDGTYVNTAGITLQQAPVTAELDTSTFSVLFTPAGGQAAYVSLSGTQTGGFPQTQITFEAWIRGYIDTAEQGLITSVPNTGMAITNTGLIYLYLNSTNVLTGVTPINDGNPHYVAVTWENVNGFATIYVDGNVDANTSGIQVGYIIPVNQELRVGVGSTTANVGFSGYIDNAAVYPTNLSQTQVTAHYDAGKTGIFSSEIPVRVASTNSAETAYTIIRDYTFSTFEGTIPASPGVLDAPTKPNVVISSVTATSPTTVRITFNIPVLRNPALEIPDNYKIDPTLKVLSVVPENITNPTYVDLVTEEMKEGENYTIIIHNTIESA